MTEIITFVPQADLDAQANMTGFIEMCRTQLTVFGASLAFDNDRWNVSEYIEHKSRHIAVNLIFNKRATSRKRQSVMMDEPFRSFAKSYIRYQHSIKPTISVTNRMAALRAIEAALLDSCVSDPVLTNAHVMNRAAQLVAKWFAPSSAYVIANQLEMIADFLCDNGLVAVRTRWRNPLKPTKHHRTVIGKAADERRAAKIPSQAALDALPKLFLVATDIADVLVSSVTAILCAAPDRISETLCLPNNCEVSQTGDCRGEEVYGLRWWAAKRGEPMVKWIIPSMAGVVEGAIGKIRKLTDEARKVARWYEQNPTRIYLIEEMEHFRTKEWLTMADMAVIVYADPVAPDLATKWCDRNRVVRQRRGRKAYMRFADVEAAVLRQLPSGFPVANRATGLKYGDALFVMLRNAMHAVKPRFRCVIEPVKYNHIGNRLSAQAPNSMRSIFDKLGFCEPNGAPIHVTTHQFRHYLNTLAQAGGLSQLDIAKWSGRKNLRQNEYYDHETSNAIVERIRDAVGDDTRFFGPLSAGPVAGLIARDELARLKVPTAHTTDFGYCIHDYVMSPCEMHRDCLNCGEQICIKGDTQKEMRIRQAHEEATRLLAMARQAEADGEFGASEWARQHEIYQIRIAGLLDVVNDPTVPEGAIIQMLPADIPSRLEHAVQARAMLLVPDGPKVSSTPKEGRCAA